MTDEHHYDSPVTNPDPRCNYSAIARLWALKDQMPSVFAARSPELQRAIPRLRAEYERTWVASGANVDDPAVQDIIDQAVGFCYYCAAPYQDRLLSRPGPPPFREDGSLTRNFGARVIGVVALCLKGDGRSYSDVADFLNAGSRSENKLTRDHVRCAVETYRKWSAKDAARAGFDHGAWIWMDQTDINILLRLLQRAKQAPRLQGLKGLALVDAILEKRSFHELFDAVSKEPIDLAAGAQWRMDATRVA